MPVAPGLGVIDTTPLLSKVGIKVVSAMNLIPVVLSGIQMVMGTVTFLQFMQQEAIKNMSQAIERHIGANSLKEAKPLLDHLYYRYYLPFVDFSNNYGWLNPYTDDAWISYADSVLKMIIGLKNKVNEG